MTKEQVKQGTKLVEKIEDLERTIEKMKNSYNLAVQEKREAFISFGIGSPSGGYITFSIPERNSIFRNKLYKLFLEESSDLLEELQQELKRL